MGRHDFHSVPADEYYYFPGKYGEYQKINKHLAKCDVMFLEALLKDHSNKKSCLASLRSRFVNVIMCCYKDRDKIVDSNNCALLVPAYILCAQVARGLCWGQGYT